MLFSLREIGSSYWWPCLWNGTANKRQAFYYRFIKCQRASWVCIPSTLLSSVVADFLKLHVFPQNCYEEARLFGCFQINLPCLQLNRERTFSGFGRSSDGCDLAKLMNAHQTRQIPDCLCLDQPSVRIPSGTAHVSRAFSTRTIITTPFRIQVASHGKSLLKAAIFTALLFSENIIALRMF